MSAATRFEWDKDRLHVDSLEVRSPTLSADASGFIARPWADCYVNLQGTMKSDLERLSERATRWTSDMVHLRGQSSEPFEIKGRLGSIDEEGNPLIAYDAEGLPITGGLVPRAVSMNAAFRFDSANFFGIETGTAKVRGILANQLVRFEPIDLRVGDGRIQASPSIRLSGDAPVLELRNESLLQQVELDANVTRSWIGYAAPIIAGSTETEGLFSLQVENASIPLTDVFAGSAKGTMTVHQARLGPGPLGTQLLGIARQIRSLIRGDVAGAAGGERTWAQMPEQQINFHLTNGRVFHDRVFLQVDDAIIA